MGKQEIKFDPQKPVEVEIKNLSPTVLFYSIYQRAPGGAWSVPIEGDIRSKEAQAETHVLPGVVPGSELFVSLGFIANPGDGYKGEVDVLQGGKSVGATGTFFREGKLDSDKKVATPEACEGVFRAP